MVCFVIGCIGFGYYFKKLFKYSVYFERFYKFNIFIFICFIWNIKEVRWFEFVMYIKKYYKCLWYILFEEVKNCKFIDCCDFKKLKKKIYYVEREKVRLEWMNSLYIKELLFEFLDNFNVCDYWYYYGGYK